MGAILWSALSAAGFAALNSAWADHYGFDFRGFDSTYYDFWAAFALYLVVLSQQRILWRGGVLANLLLFTVHGAGLIKFEVLGEMPRVADLAAAPALADAFGWAPVVGVLVLWTAMLVALIWNARLNPFSLGLTGAVVLGFGVFAYSQAQEMDVAASRGYATPAPAALRYGHLLAFLLDGIG